METIKDKVVLITGAGSGLGKAIAEVLACDGAQVLLGDVKKDAVDALAQSLSDQGCKAQSLALDVGSEQSVDEAVENIMKKFGRLDVLVNNAGVDFTKSITELEVKEWDKVIAVNLRGPFLLSKKVFPLMAKAKQGQIINITSTAAKRNWPNASAYHASKWGLLGFSHALHTEGRPLGIKVTAVVAGGMRTPFIMERFPDTDPGVLQDPKNVAEAVRFILTMPKETVIPEVMVIPMRETSWP